MSHTNISILGATGYIGGIVLLELLKRQDCHVTALVRSEDKARKLQALNLGTVKVVLGSANDAAAVDACLENADVVIDTFNSDDVEGTATLLAGCKKLSAATQKKIPLIHVSGGGVLIDLTGKNTTEEVWDDADAEQMAKIPAGNPHCAVDLAILKADAEGYIKSHIVIPSVVYGALDNVLSRAGLQKANNMCAHAIVGPVVGLGGSAVTVNGGRNKWLCIHVEDVASLILTVLDNVENEPHGPEAYYFGESFEIEPRRIAAMASKALTGDVTDERALTDEELKTFFPGRLYEFIPLLAATYRCKGTRGRRLGWSPKYGLAELESDVIGITEDTKRTHVTSYLG